MEGGGRIMEGEEREREGGGGGGQAGREGKRKDEEGREEWKKGPREDSNTT